MTIENVLRLDDFVELLVHFVPIQLVFFDHLEEVGDTQDKYATICKHYLTSVSAMLDSLLFLVGVPVLRPSSRGPINVDGSPALVFDRFSQGSKDIVRLEGGKIRTVGQSSLLNQRSIDDLTSIRNTLVERQVKVNDLQFLIGNNGRIVIADPLDVVVGATPSKNNLRMIDLLIRSAQGNR